MVTQTAPIDFYSWTTPNGRKIAIMLEELGVPYNLHLIDIGAGDQFRPEFLAISPNNRIPAIVDPEGPGGEPISVFESGAILKYLGEKFGRFYPADPRERVKVDEWLFWQMGGLGPMVGQNHHFTAKDKTGETYAFKRYRDETHRLYGVLNTQLEGHDYVAGDELSIADIACLPWTENHKGQGMDIDEFPNVKAWRERLHQRPAFEKGLASGIEERKKLREVPLDEQHKVLYGQRAR